MLEYEFLSDWCNVIKTRWQHVLYTKIRARSHGKHIGGCHSQFLKHKRSQLLQAQPVKPHDVGDESWDERVSAHSLWVHGANPEARTSFRPWSLQCLCRNPLVSTSHCSGRHEALHRSYGISLSFMSLVAGLPLSCPISGTQHCIATPMLFVWLDRIMQTLHYFTLS